MNHIPILHHIFLTFGAHFARFFGFGFAAERYKIIISNHLRADKAAFEIGVDHAGGLRGGVAFVDGPGADSILSAIKTVYVTLTFARWNLALEASKFRTTLRI